MKVERREMQHYRDPTQTQSQNFVKGVRFFYSCTFLAGNTRNRPFLISLSPPVSVVFPISSCRLISMDHLMIQYHLIESSLSYDIFLGSKLLPCRGRRTDRTQSDRRDRQACRAAGNLGQYQVQIFNIVLQLINIFDINLIKQFVEPIVG